MGPLSMYQDKEKARMFDTAAKRDEAGMFTTGKTARKHLKGEPVSVDAAPKHLAARIRAYDSLKDKSANRRPGSNKRK